MDVAEQALTALEMLSRRHGKAILQCVSKFVQYKSIAVTTVYQRERFRMELKRIDDKVEITIAIKLNG